MDVTAAPPLEAFVPVLTWAGPRPSLAELSTWHEALHDAVAGLMPADILGCWLYPARGGSVLVGPRSLTADILAPPLAEPLVTQEGLFALEDRLRAGGYQSVMAVPIRAEVQDVGLLLVGSFRNDAYTFADQRSLHRVAGQLATSCRRMAGQAWVRPRPAAVEHNATVTGVTEGVLEAMRRARHGSDLVQLASDALALQLPHDRLELVAVAPAPDCWALVGRDRGGNSNIAIGPDQAEAIDGLVHQFRAREVARIGDVHAVDAGWPVTTDPRAAERIQSVLAARLEVADELVGWLLIGSENAGWFKEEDEAVAHLAAELLSARVSAWAARAELAGAWA